MGQVAQLVEHRTENPGVGGSIPPLTTFFETQQYSAVNPGSCDMAARLLEAEIGSVVQFG